MFPLPLLERKLHIVPLRPFPFRRHLVPHPQHLLRDIHALKRTVVAHALKEGNTVTRSGARGRREHAVGGGFADAVRERFEALPDCYHEGARHGRNVDPVAREVLRLEPTVRGRLEKVRGQHAILVRADALAFRAAFVVEGGYVGVFDDFDLVLLVGVEEAVECCGW